MGSNVNVRSTVDPPKPNRPGWVTTSVLLPSTMTSRHRLGTDHESVAILGQRNGVAVDLDVGHRQHRPRRW